MSSALPPEADPAGRESRPDDARARLRGHRRSLATRLLLGLLAILTVTMAGWTAYIMVAAQNMVDRQLATSLSAAWERAASQVYTTEPVPPVVGAPASAGANGSDDPERHRPGSLAQPVGTLVGTASRSGLADHSGSALEASVLEPSGHPRTLTSEERHDVVHAVRGIAQGEQVSAEVGGVTYELQAGGLEPSAPWLAGDQVLVVGLPTQEMAEGWRDGMAVTLAGVVGLVAVTSGFGWWWIRRTLRPLEEVAQVAADVARMDLAGGGVDVSHARVPRSALEGADEVAVVGQAMDRLVGAVDSALARRLREDQELRRFVADASHELRTPLASVRGYAEMLALTEDLSEGGRRSLARVLDQADRMGVLVDGMLVLARLEAVQRGRALGLDAPDGEADTAVDVCEVVLDAVMDARAAWPDHRWEVELPDQDGSPCGVPGDRDRLSRIVGNLLSNAGRHTPAGTTVAVSLAPVALPGSGDAGMRVRVQDDGGGIPPEIRPGLFDRFVRGGGPLPAGEHSSGLGLPIVRAAARGLGGDVTAEFGEGGTRFDVVLPRVITGNPGIPREENRL